MSSPELPTLYTPGVVVRRLRLEVVNPETPISVYEDAAGNHALADGNHRSYKAWLLGIAGPERVVIGTIKKDVSQDPDFRPISDLKVIED